MENIERPKFLRAKGVAKRFSIGESTVWYYLKMGKIKSNKIRNFLFKSYIINLVIYIIYHFHLI